MAFHFVNRVVSSIICTLVLFPSIYEVYGFGFDLGIPSVVTNFSSGVGEVVKAPVDVVASVPGKVVSTAGDAWSTVSETVVNQDPELSVKYYLYDNPSNLEEYKQIVVGQVDSLRSVRISKDTTLRILIHGFMQDYNSSYPQQMKDTLLMHTGDPVVIVDWGHLADGKFGPEAARAILYPFIVDNVADVGQYVANFIVFLKDNEALSSLDQVHILGFSLGAHVSGIAGWTVQNATDGEKVARITGLDPAGPKFFLKRTERRLNQDDAKFVDVIHTSHLGYFLQMGHLDFFPNGGKIQPGCVETESGITDTVTSLGSLLTGSCSHSRAWKYYLRSIKDNEFYGCECNNIFKYEFTGCEVECEDKVPFGELAPSKARGNYYLSI
ncbi:unnamed protein product [Orchesella dallaii]|uniref:Lipase domain-containing protein n=1 Tax=Orchesella dallaii TaxID=48710 RepID=A0ABP1QB46_9HEXA